MILQSIKLENFRQFYGKQEILFATDPIKNITLIHAENGVGKTALLNSILWCLFEKTTPNFIFPKELLNNEAQLEGLETYSVTLNFHHDEKDYSVIRATNNSSKIFRVHQIIDGNFVEHSSPLYFINSVIPKEMAEYFFFQSEGLGSITSHIGEGGIREAIRKILGFSLAERAIEDLTDYKRRIQKEAANLSNTDELSNFRKRQKTIEEIKQQNEKTRNDSITLTAINKGKIKEIEKQLRGLPDATDVQKKRDSLNKEFDIATNELKNAKSDELSLISRYGMALFGKKMASVSLEFIDESIYKGKIPSPHNETLVQDLLNAQSCICKRPLPLGTPEYAAIASLLKNAGNAAIYSKIMKARSAIIVIENKFSDALPAFKGAASRIALADAGLAKINSELKECSEKLKDINVEEIKLKENALINLSANNDKELREQVRLKSIISDNNEELARLEKSIKATMSQQPRLKLLKEKSDFVQSLINCTNSELQDHEKRSKKFLVEKINETLEEFSRKDFHSHLDEDFNLNLRNSSGTGVAMSDGERLLLSLAFISTLIWFAEQRVNSKGNILVSGAVAPFVIDAPFGALDKTYKAATASFLPKRARQIVFLLSSSHWTGEVDDATNLKIGAEYILISERKHGNDIKPLDKIKGTYTVDTP